MLKSVEAETFAEQINDSFSDESVKAWPEVHGKNEAELVVEVNYRDEDTERLHLQSEHQAMAVFKLIYASKEQGLEDGMGV